MNFDKCLNEFEKYTHMYDLSVKENKYKYEHTLRVVEFAETICNNENFNDEEKNIALICSLLHDIARFEEWTKYNSWNEIDHGDLGYDILILDHHLSSGYCQDAVVINNQLSKNYPNKALSGAGVVYKFLKYFESNKEIKFADAFLDLVAVAHVADCMNTNTLENRYINKVGLSNIFNEGLRALIKQQAYSLFRMKTEDITEEFLDNCRLTQTQVAYYIAPLVNALIRVGNQNEKDLLFKAFTETYALEEIPSTKRGHSNETETISEQNARNCSNARARQNKEKEKAGELLDIQIIENCLDENQILVLHADDLNVSTTLTGLCATEIVSRYKKPVLLGRTNSEGLFRGSVRGVSNCELTDTKQFLLDSNLMDYAEG